MKSAADELPGTRRAASRRAPAYRRSPAEKRELLLGAAERLFVAEGYDNVSTARIAEAAGVSEGILFHHYGSKLGLLAALAERFARSALAASAPPDPSAAIDAAMIRNAFDHADRTPGLHRLLEDTGRRLDGFDLTARNEIVLSSIEDKLTRDMADGVVRRGDPRVMAEVVLAIVDGAYQAWQRRAEAEQREMYIAEAAHAVRAFLAPIDGDRLDTSQPRRSPGVGEPRRTEPQEEGT